MNWRHPTPTLQAIGRRLARAWRMHVLRVRIHQQLLALARPDLWPSSDPVIQGLMEARLAELRCELNTLELQQ